MWFLPGSAVVVSVALLGGCLGDEESDRPSHWPGDDLVPCDTARRSYRIDELILPRTPGEAADLGWDLDFDGVNDNRGGDLVDIIGDYFGADLMAVVSATLADDAVHIGVSVETCAETPYSLVELHRGREIDRSVDPPLLLAVDVTEYAMVASGPLPGAAVHGWSQFPVGSMLHRDEQVWIDGPQFVAEIDAIDDAEVSGNLVAAFDGEQLFATVSGAFQRVVADRIADNPGCTAAACGDETLRTLLGVFDDNEDGEVTLAEIQSNSLVTTLLRPDIDGDGPVWTTPDGMPDQFSVGVGFHASRVDLILDDDQP